MREIYDERFRHRTWYIDTQKGLNEAAGLLAKGGRIGIDTESNSLHAYSERVCVVQISNAKSNFIIDPLGDIDLSPLGEVMANARVEKVFHGADYDIGCLKRDFKFEFRSIFDTMVTAQYLNYEQIGLANMVENRLDVKLEKKYTKSDWGRRPLHDEQIVYLVHDSEFLLPLSAILKKEARKAGVMEEAELEFRRLESIPALLSGDKRQDFWSIKGVKKLPLEATPYAYELYLWRENRAAAADMPPFKILSNETLMSLAMDRPKNIDGLLKIRGVSNLVARRYGRALLGALAKGQKRRPQSIPEPKRKRSRRSVSIENREFVNALTKWRRTAAEKRNVHPLAVLPGIAMEEVARERPESIEDLSKIEHLGEKRVKLYGPELLKLSKKFPPQSPFK